MQKKEHGSSAFSVKGFPIALCLSQENKIHAHTEAMNTERIESLL